MKTNVVASFWRMNLAINVESICCECLATFCITNVYLEKFRLSLNSFTSVDMDGYEQQD